MALSKVELINRALTKVGAAPITSLTDSTNNARIANRVYDSALRSILEECKWNFATKRLTLSSSADSVDWYDTGETYVYQKPADLIKIHGTNYEAATWRVEGEHIFSDTAALGIRYVYFIDEPAKFPSAFAEALEDKLCSDMAYAIVNSRILGEQYYERYEKISLPKAMSSNSQVGTQQTPIDDAWTRAKSHNNQSEA